MSVCDNCRFKTTYGDICKKGIYIYSNLLCPEHDEDMKIHGNHADHVFVDTIQVERTNPFYFTTIPSVKKVIFHPPATIILWDDDTKTVVKCREGETYDPEVGLAMCLCTRMLGKKYRRRWFKDALKKGGWEDA